MPETAVSLYGERVKRNAPPEIGGDRVFDWDPKLKATPDGKEMLPATINMRDFEKHPWKTHPRDRQRKEMAYWMPDQMKELQRLHEERLALLPAETRAMLSQRTTALGASVSSEEKKREPTVGSLRWAW